MKIQSVVDIVSNNLRGKIIHAVLYPGQRIKEMDIMEELGISRSPIREALKILESEGLITIKPRKGAFVSEVTQKDIWEIYTVNASLTVLAIDIAMEKISEEDIKKSESFIKKMEEGARQDPEDIEKYRKYHRMFHENILQIAGNNRLMQICNGLDNQTNRFSKIIFSNKEYLVASLKRHEEILEAIKNKDRDLAAKVTYEHIMEGMKNLQDIFEKSEMEGGNP
jgi:DNA-binding GntR family transcriptional regulator